MRPDVRYTRKMDRRMELSRNANAFPRCYQYNYYSSEGRSVKISLVLIHSQIAHTYTHTHTNTAQCKRVYNVLREHQH